MTTDFLANATICCITLAIMSLYITIVILPPWDDGTGIRLPTSTTSNDTEREVENLKNKYIYPGTEQWSKNLDYQFGSFVSSSSYNNNNNNKNRNENEKKEDSATVTLYDPFLELGRSLVLSVKYCRQNENNNKNKLCPCSSSSHQDNNKKHILNCIDDVNSGASHRLFEKHIRSVAKKQAGKLEIQALERLLIRLQYYYQTNAGIDVLFTSIFGEGILEPEKASSETRRTNWLFGGQPRLPPASYFSSSTTTKNLRFLPAEKDDRWIYDLAMDPQANALKHAPFVFPMFLVFITCFLRIVKGSLQLLKKEKRTEKKVEVGEKQEEKKNA